MDEKEKQKLMEKFKEMGIVDEDALKEALASYTEDVAKAKEENTELKARIEALENTPKKKIDLSVPGTDKKVEVMYKKTYVPNKGEVLKLYHTPEKQVTLAKGFIDWVEGVQEGKEMSLRKAMNEGTPADGGYTVFDEYISELLAFARLTSFALQECRVIDVGSDVIHIPTEATSVSTAWKAETIAAAESNPTVGELKLEPEKLTAYSTITNELLEDSEFDLVSWLTGLFAENIGQELDDQVLNGDESGTDPFAGILNCSTIVDSTGTLNIAHLTDVLSKVPPNKINNAKFMFHRLVYYPHILGMTDTAGNAIYPPTVASPNSLWGFPVLGSEKMPSTIANGQVVGLFGNFMNYIIARRKAAGALDVDIYGKFLENMTRFRTVSRWHGKPWDCTGMVQLIY